MAVLGPKDLALKPDEIQEVDKLEQEVNAKIQALSDRGVTDNLHVDLNHPSSPRIQNELIRRSKAAGWGEVEVIRGGYGYKFKA